MSGLSIFNNLSHEIDILNETLLFSLLRYLILKIVNENRICVRLSNAINRAIIASL